jgi:hypothetical protein
MAKKQSETALVKACLHFLWAHGCDVSRNNTGSYLKTYTTKDGRKRSRLITYGCVGSPDITGYTPYGRWIGVECKVGSNRLSPEQRAFQARCDAKGAIYIVARCLEDLQAWTNTIVGVPEWLKS